MRERIEKLLSIDDWKRKWTAVGLTVILSGLFTFLGIYGIGQYGIALFILTPVFIGAGSEQNQINSGYAPYCTNIKTRI
jgi:hypothetical protein